MFPVMFPEIFPDMLLVFKLLLCWLRLEGKTKGGAVGIKPDMETIGEQFGVEEIKGFRLTWGC